MTEEQKEKFRKQLESYKKDLIKSDNESTKKIDFEKEKFNISKENLQQKKKIKPFIQNITDEVKTIKDKTLNLDISTDITNANNNDKTDKLLKNSVQQTLETKNEFIEKKQERITLVNKEIKSSNTINLDTKKNGNITTKENFFELKEKENDILENKKKTELKIKNDLSKEQIISKNIDKKEKLISEKKKIENPKELKEDKKLIQNTNKTTIKTEIPKDDSKDKKSKIGFKILPILLLFIAGAYYFYNSSLKTKQKEKENILSKEKAIMTADSILLFEKENVEKVENEIIESTVNISDTIFNIISEYPVGYYVVVGSYADLDNAEKLQKKNPTIFESYIFNGKSKRVALLIGDDESSVFEQLETIRYKYPDAWILYNKN